ncbi:PIF1-like helicase-domain-containing protein [Sphaerosporella brunnea]|uniref:ATP-dependent DNA helicase n=1 Tax=Sphaerosporella brunnea TaxID=1250544 RepID=A0A5J5F4N4_9PEZI|nr:PIF1-like helicase-domain-containing protein [Sphaerosporella brunnea]
MASLAFRRHFGFAFEANRCTPRLTPSTPPKVPHRALRTSHPMSRHLSRRQAEGEVALSKEQKRALDRAKAGKNLFITGRAGTGKTILIRAINSWATSREKGVTVTAPTGAAALLIDGTTIHTWAGVGMAEKSARYYATVDATQIREENQYPLSLNFEKTELLIIDEISMVGWFDCLSC